MEITYLDKIRYLYPNIQRVMQWHTDAEGNELGYDGIQWENTEIDKPSKAALDAIPDADVLAFLADQKLDALCDELKTDVMAKMMYFAEKKSNPNLTFKDYIKSIRDMDII